MNTPRVSSLATPNCRQEDLSLLREHGKLKVPVSVYLSDILAMLKGEDPKSVKIDSYSNTLVIRLF